MMFELGEWLGVGSRRARVLVLQRQAKMYVCMYCLTSAARDVLPANRIKDGPSSVGLA